MEILNEIVQDNDSEIQRFQAGGRIGNRKEKDIANEEDRKKCKQKLQSGKYSPIQLVKAISHSVDTLTYNYHGCIEPHEEADDPQALFSFFHKYSISGGVSSVSATEESKLSLFYHCAAFKQYSADLVGTESICPRPQCGS
ncbi:unnamed protein product [Sphagnum tenellum]